jgi:GH35 family endo-1,4-beta-xylanase
VRRQKTYDEGRRRALRDNGVQVCVSELDVNDTVIPGTEGRVKAASAETYHNYLTDELSVAFLKRLIFWAISDRFDSNDVLTTIRAGWQRPGGLPHGLGLRNRDFAPNPAYGSLCEDLANYSGNRGKG